MRIRFPFAGLFFLLLLLAGYAGLTPLQVNAVVNDKVVHLVTFFLLTLVFYWIIDTNRRRTLNMTLVVCTAGLGIGSEFLQALLPNGRDFDLYDIIANIVGSLAGLGLCSWYHKRMLERKRVRKSYNAVPGEDLGDEEDLELGEGIGMGVGHEEGVIADGDDDDSVPGVVHTVKTTAAATTSNGVGGVGGAVGGGRTAASLEEEVDNWDENAVDAWDEDDMGDMGAATGTTSMTTDKKRAD
ncbi:hypothetical protein B0T17DRAFT_617386 [Bombardia bombarda]|uniref:VanZ-like domain-containing protein n=1 Tax=Bombardia bombarda TaxID=252184 RepID=A0AA39X1K1_9PEZI|nr:hypothetical protein B0T17DRAFT_617386 [Bombardia bombarda]